MSNEISNYFKNSIDVKYKLLSPKYISAISRMSKLASSSIVQGGKIFFCGNGGSAADAQHLAAELLVRLKKKIIEKEFPP